MQAYEVSERNMSKYGNSRLESVCVDLGLKADLPDIINVNYQEFTGKSASYLRAKFDLNVYEESSSLRETLAKRFPDLVSYMATAEMSLALLLWRMKVTDRHQALKLAEQVFNKAAAAYHDTLELEHSFKLTGVNPTARPRRTNLPQRIKEMFWW